VIEDFQEMDVFGSKCRVDFAQY